LSAEVPSTQAELGGFYLLATLTKIAAACKINPISKSSIPRRVNLFLRASLFMISCCSSSL